MTDTSQLRNKLATRAGHAPATGGSSITDLINSQRAEIARALPKHMDADRLARIALTSMRTTPQLLECSQQSLLGALMLSAQTGLEPGPLGHVYLVPRRIKGQMECQWMLGYKGIIELARRSGKIVSIEAREVCENDEFSYAYGLDEQLEHKPFMGGERGPIVAVWGLAKFKDGGHYFLVMSKADVDAAKGRSDSAKSGFGPWVTDYAAMARKTVIRRMMPFLPLSAEQATMIAFDERVNTRVDAHLLDEPPVYIDTTTAATADAGDDDYAPGEEPEPEAVSEPDPAGAVDDDSLDDGARSVPPDGDSMTDAQSKALHALLRKNFDGASGPARFPILSAALGREITSTKQISKAEASMLIDSMQDGGPGDDTAPAEEEPF